MQWKDPFRSDPCFQSRNWNSLLTSVLPQFSLFFIFLKPQFDLSLVGTLAPPSGNHGLQTLGRGFFPEARAQFPFFLRDRWVLSCPTVLSATPGMSQGHTGFSLGRTHFVLGTSPGFLLVLHNGSPVCPWGKPTLSLGQSCGRRVAQKVYVKSLCAFFARNWLKQKLTKIWWVKSGENSVTNLSRRRQGRSLKNRLEMALNLVAWFARIDSHDSRESGDSRESEIRVSRANRPDAL